jgi:hypothetical protein
MQGPQDLVIPTPPPAGAAAAAAGPISDLPLVTDPVSAIQPGSDPAVATLLNQISQQQLIGYVQTLENFRTRNTYSVVDVEGEGIGAARRWLYNEFIRVGNGRLLVEIDEFPHGSTTQQNIVATLQGTSGYPGVILVSAHYDSRTVSPNDGSSYAPGANDNGTGVAAMLEMARLLSAQTWNQTIMFVGFAAEEQGRYGSIHFANNRMLQGVQIDAVINLDIIGGRPGIPQSVRLFATGAEETAPRQLARYMTHISGLYKDDFSYTVINAQDREGRYGDHMSFLQVGIPAVRITESEEDRSRQHNNADRADLIDYNYLLQVTQINLAVVANFAGAPPPPKAPTIIPSENAGTVNLNWVPDERAAGYVVSFRPADSTVLAPFRYVNAADAGNVAFTDLTPGVTYQVSIAPFDGSGRIGGFSPEVAVVP